MGEGHFGPPELGPEGIGGEGRWVNGLGLPLPPPFGLIGIKGGLGNLGGIGMEGLMWSFSRGIQESNRVVKLEQAWGEDELIRTYRWR